MSEKVLVSSSSSGLSAIGAPENKGAGLSAIGVPENKGAGLSAIGVPENKGLSAIYFSYGFLYVLLSPGSIYTDPLGKAL